MATTDLVSRARFRRYWAALSPGILLIRREALRLVKAEAEHRQSLPRAAAARQGLPFSGMIVAVGPSLVPR